MRLFGTAKADPSEGDVVIARKVLSLMLFDVIDHMLMLAQYGINQIKIRANGTRSRHFVSISTNVWFRACQTRVPTTDLGAFPPGSFGADCGLSSFGCELANSCH
ncbi:hypothetical protein X740_05110 [Mesorhizobium sp. LNHC221B00]|nr:hypothetical protein X740_05110 [Mesorhizobium sp. LNHC221B00]